MAVRVAIDWRVPAGAVVLGALSSLAVPGLWVAAGVTPDAVPRQVTPSGEVAYVIGCAAQPGLSWRSACREAPLVNQAPCADGSCLAVEPHEVEALESNPEDVVGTLSAGWPWPLIRMSWLRSETGDFPSDPRDNLSESGPMADAVRRAVTQAPTPHVRILIGAAAADILVLSCAWMVPLTLAARAARSSPARRAPAPARP